MAINTSGFASGREELAQTAEEFTQQMYNLSHAIQLDFNTLVRVSVLRVHSSIIKRSPVDTGAYRASHGIATGSVSEEEGKESGTAAAVSWTWQEGDGPITLFNNQPYAEVIEFGGYPNPPKSGTKTIGGFSKQAPQGVYSVAVAEFAQHVQATIAELGLDYYKGGHE